MRPDDLRTSSWSRAGYAFDRSMADLLCHRSIIGRQHFRITVRLPFQSLNKTSYRNAAKHDALVIRFSCQLNRPLKEDLSPRETLFANAPLHPAEFMRFAALAYPQGVSKQGS